MAVDDPAVGDAEQLEALEPARVVGDGRAPRDVVHAAGALAARLGRRRVVGDRAAAALAAQLPRAVAGRPRVEHLLQQAAAALRVGAVRAHRVEALQRVLGRDLGVLGAERLVDTGAHGQLVPQALEVGEAQGVAVALGLDALGGEPRLPEVERRGRADARDDRVDHAGAGAAGDRARVLEERQLRARAPTLVGVEQVVDARVVLVDGLGRQPQPEDARIEIEVPRRVPGDRGDVVDAFEVQRIWVWGLENGRFFAPLVARSRTLMMSTPRPPSLV